MRVALEREGRIVTVVVVAQITARIGCSSSSVGEVIHPPTWRKRAMPIRYIQRSELEPLARRIWHAKRNKATRVNGGKEKHATFEAMGFATRSTEFPYGVRSGEWVEAGGDLEICYSHGKWDIPGIMKVRKGK
jgi:hypothetical protein